jgi:hypothetical protein
MTKERKMIRRSDQDQLARLVATATQLLNEAPAGEGVVRGSASDDASGSPV